MNTKYGDLAFQSVVYIVQAINCAKVLLYNIVSFNPCNIKCVYLQISKGPTQQWKLVLEHRSFGYNWLQQMRAQTDKDKRDGFMYYIKQLSKDKITFFTQGGSKG